MYNNITVQGLDALLWTLIATATVLSVGRFAIRYITARRFYADDASHLFSVLLLIGLGVAYTMVFPHSARLVRIAQKLERAPPLSDPFYRQYLQLRLAISLLFFMTIWSVKLTFLLFYRLLFNVSDTFIKMWWAVVAFIFATFWVCFGITFTLCGHASNLYNYEKCSSPKALHDIRATYKIWCALNVASDLFVIVLPLYILWGLQVPKTQKAGLAGIFSLGLVIPAFDILRTVESLKLGTFSGVGFWSSMELGFAVIASSLPLYRALAGKRRKDISKYIQWERYRRFGNRSDDRDPKIAGGDGKSGSRSSSKETDDSRKNFSVGGSLSRNASHKTYRDDLEMRETAFVKSAAV